MAYEVSIELTCPDTAPASIRLPRYWSAMRDLNPRPRAPKARALPSCANRRNSGMRGENSEPPVHSSRPDDRKHPLKSGLPLYAALWSDLHMADRPQKWSAWRDLNSRP